MIKVVPVLAPLGEDPQHPSPRGRGLSTLEHVHAPVDAVEGNRVHGTVPGSTQLASKLVNPTVAHHELKAARDADLVCRGRHYLAQTRVCALLVRQPEERVLACGAQTVAPGEHDKAISMECIRPPKPLRKVCTTRAPRCAQAPCPSISPPPPAAYAAYSSPSGLVRGSIMNGWYATEMARPGFSSVCWARALSRRALPTWHQGQATSDQTSMVIVWESAMTTRGKRPRAGGSGWRGPAA
eukprot:CAMPEP_0206049464 /NCGR_PEP_ID=MMETSP1466-20131121/26886_1 /ASSEMBLY_ACC=CAM_ASM_001126 /TAXON_ID=44452 /ORGANISM="Pavlova gyrans, Strain CCMP608" /LENGTH=239 /DNA_ID=CAMNT_0053424549 /DNA_START=304 /DNA_END=1021 /DNA_ORIENTATION=+